MTLPTSGSLSLTQINAEFGLGTNLAAYRGVRWYKDDASTGFFPTTNISIANFYGTRPGTPVTAGSQTFTSSGTFGVPIYTTLTVTLRAGSGGGGGGSGNISAGFPGTAGGNSAFGAYGTALAGGGGGINLVNGLNGNGSDGNPPGGGGGAGAFVLTGGTTAGFNGGAGGAGGLLVLVLTNPIVGGSGPAAGSTVSVTVGGAGAGGGGGIYVPTGLANTPANYRWAQSGFAGGNGSVVIQWA